METKGRLWSVGFVHEAHALRLSNGPSRVSIDMSENQL